MKIKQSQLRRIIQEALAVPSWVEGHYAWRNVVFTRDGELRYINDVGSPETARASETLGKPIPPGTNVLVVMGPNPGSKSVWMHDAELLELIEREGWHERNPPEGSDPEGFWNGKGEWQETNRDDFALPPDLELPPAIEGKMRIKKSELSRLIREAIIDEAGYGIQSTSRKYNVGDIVRYKTLGGAERIVKVEYRITDDEVEEDLEHQVEYSPDGIKNGYPGFEGTIVLGKEKGRQAWGYDKDIIRIES